jgi:hypothetical protein
MAALLMLARPGWARAVTPSPPPAQPAPAVGPPPPGAAALPPHPLRLIGPLVYLRADNPLTMLQVQMDLEQWRDVCHVPCGIPVDPSQIYRVTGRRFVPTDAFTLPRSSGQVMIGASMGWKGRNLSGRILTPIGGVLAVVGVLLFLSGRQAPAGGNDTFARQTELRNRRVYGVAGAVAGVGITLAGLILWRTNVSRVDVE